MNYNQVCLIPNLGIITSRSEADVSCEFAGRNWKLPCVPSNMECSIDFKLAEWMSDNNFFYILHRFYDYDLIFNWIKNNQNRYISISVGVKEKDKELLNKIEKSGLRIDCITLDVAHGFSITTKNMCKYIKKLFEKNTFLIVGNVFGDELSIKFLEDCGADAIKVGLAFGKACTTYNQTGFASPMFSCGIDASKYTKLPLIGDGGIRENGDFSKGLVAGYKMLMAGSIFSQCIDSPSPLLDNGYKVYYGSASAISKNNTNQDIQNIEGKAIEILCNNLTYEQKFKEIEENIRSAVSYAGGKNLSAFNKVKWTSVTR